MHLAHLYILLGQSPPAALSQPIAPGGPLSETGGAMRRATERTA
jgi:hypothetical protein